MDTEGQFSSIEAAGKFGRVLSILSANDEQTISKNKLIALAKANSINPKLELPTLLQKMDDQHLVSRSDAGDVTVLGLTHGVILERTADYFKSLSPEKEESAVVGMAEMVSKTPIISGEMAEYISDSYRIRSRQVQTVRFRLSK